MLTLVRRATTHETENQVNSDKAQSLLDLRYLLEIIEIPDKDSEKLKLMGFMSVASIPLRHEIRTLLHETSDPVPSPDYGIFFPDLSIQRKAFNTSCLFFLFINLYIIGKQNLSITFSNAQLDSV